MKKFTLGLLVLSLFLGFHLKAQYNNLWIPDTLNGTTFNLNIKDTFSQIRPGQQTITAGINNKFWGPTLFFNKGETVHMNVKNSLNDSTTLHWHGMHLPAVMDGGPHQVIPPGTTWQPFWEVKNNAATYWYHPHLHETTQEQITKGIGGLIIVRDSVESSLPLPRKYGIDDIPLVLTDRDFTTTNQFSVVPYGDSSMVNGVLSPQFTIPAQVVRFRILNAAIERSFNLGFSDNRTFYVITSDGGLLTAPVPLTRYLLSAGERIEILVNCVGQSSTSFNLRAFNSTLTQNIPGGDAFPNGPFANALQRIDFNMLHLNVGAQTSNPIVAIPTALTTVNTIPAASANLTRFLTISDTNIAGIPGASFLLNHRLFNINYNNYNVPLDNTEIWQITNSGNFGHPFHIHDVEFNILSVNGAAPAAAQAGWKDVVFVAANTTVKFIAKFDDFADNTHPFMYHCHIALHEDEGMMGQFVVGSSAVSPTISSLSCTSATYSATATANTAYNGTATVGYTGGNGIAYTTGATVFSTGVTGLTATLQAGTLASGTGNIVYAISGTPSTSGTASFAISFGGQTCTLNLTVNTSVPQPSANRNVMLIIADDMGTDYLGFYENHQDTVDVPNLRSLLSRGVRFSNATANPVCSATRASMLTGRYGFRTGVGGIIGGIGGSGVLDTTEVSLPKMIKLYNPNIKRALIGKWHLQQPTPINLTAPNRMGFDHYEGLFTGTLNPGYNNWTKIKNGVSSTMTTYATTEQANNMSSWLRTNATSPFYACLSFTAPHDPIHLPPAGLHNYTTLSGTPVDINNNPKAYYKAMIQSMDHELGRVFDSLRAINRFDSTDFIFIGDNGSLARVAQIADTSRAKGTLYQYGIHVPLIIAGPSVVNPGRVSNALVNATDVFATVLELYGYNNWQSQIPVGRTIDSKSLMPIIKNQSTSVRPWAFSEIFKQTTDSSDGKAIQNQNYKLIRFDYGAEKFYKLSADPNEQNNLLVGTMNGVDSTNYNYLCNQLSTLVNNGVICPSIATGPVVTNLLCSNVVYTSTNVYANTPFFTTATIPYNGGNGVAYSAGWPIASTGVTGLNATLQAGTLNIGNGNASFEISGTPSSNGIANFSLQLGGQTCNVSLQVNAESKNVAFDFFIVSDQMAYPAINKIDIKLSAGSEAYYVWVYDAVGRTIMMLPQPNLSAGINVSGLNKGVYLLKIMDKTNKQVITKKFIKG